MECPCGGQAKSSSQNKNLHICGACKRTFVQHTEVDLFNMPLGDGEYEKARPYVAQVREKYPKIAMCNETKIVRMIAQGEVIV